MEDRLRHLGKQIRQREEMASSMALARTRQKRMLPDEPKVAGYEFAQKYEPATDVSGDFYDFIQVSDNQWGIVIGDVAGHGVEAGIIMGMAKQTVSIYGRQFVSPTEVLDRSNRELYRWLDGKMFVSLSYAVLDVDTSILHFARAGHNKPLRFNSNWRIPRPQVVECSGMALGVDAGPRFAKLAEEVEIHLEPGDVFFQYTDGLVEAANKDKEQFGEENLMLLLQRYARAPVQELVDIVIEALRDHAMGAPQEDDITMVALKVKDRKVASRTARTQAFPLPQVSPAPGPPAPAGGPPAGGRTAAPQALARPGWPPPPTPVAPAQVRPPNGPIPQPPKDAPGEGADHSGRGQ